MDTKLHPATPTDRAPEPSATLVTGVLLALAVIVVAVTATVTGALGAVWDHLWQVVANLLGWASWIVLGWVL